MNIYARIDAFAQLGAEIEKRTQKERWESVLQKASAAHPFFTKSSIHQALDALQKGLNTESLHQWCQNYPLLYSQDTTSANKERTIALIMAGNIPLVGFHDFVATLLTGANVLIKPSSNDTYLLEFLSELLIEINSAFASKIQFTNAHVKDFDAIIATGSNNSSRYFDYYFGKYPHIIRRNRNSCAVLTAKETQNDLRNLASDIMDYYGLGCRNVSKIYIPSEYSLLPLMTELQSYESYSLHNAYKNNYDYQKSLLLINKTPHLDNGIILFRENTALATPVSVCNYEYYQDMAELRKQFENQKENIQCVVSAEVSDIPFGQTQSPQWMDYADGKDIIKFVLSL